MTNQIIKRVTTGGYIKADMTGTGVMDIGRITDFNAERIYFISATDGNKHSVVRNAAMKATKEEYEAAIKEHKGTKTSPKAKFTTPIPAVEPDTDKRSIVLARYLEGYVKVRSAKGNSSAMCGDIVATYLSNKTLEECKTVVGALLEEPAVSYTIKWGHLNIGQQRMLIGNRLRKAVSDGFVSPSKLKK